MSDAWSLLEQGNWDAARPILESRYFDINTRRTFDGCTVLHVICKTGHVELLHNLLVHQLFGCVRPATATATTTAAALHSSAGPLASWQPKLSATTAAAIDRRPHIDATLPDHEGLTPLHHCFYNFHLACARLLLDHFGWDLILIESVEGFTPLDLFQNQQFVRQGGFKPEVSYLCSWGHADNYQLGHHSSTGPCEQPRLIADPCGRDSLFESPIRCVDTCKFYTVCVDTNNNIYLWGIAFSRNSLTIPIPKRVARLQTGSCCVSVCCCDSHTVVLTAGGQVYLLYPSDYSGTDRVELTRVYLPVETVSSVCCVPGWCFALGLDGCVYENRFQPDTVLQHKWVPVPELSARNDIRSICWYSYGQGEQPRTMMCALTSNYVLEWCVSPRSTSPVTARSRIPSIRNPVAIDGGDGGLIIRTVQGGTKQYGYLYRPDVGVHCIPLFPPHRRISHYQITSVSLGLDSYLITCLGTGFDAGVTQLWRFPYSVQQGTLSLGTPTRVHAGSLAGVTRVIASQNHFIACLAAPLSPSVIQQQQHQQQQQELATTTSVSADDRAADTAVPTLISLCEHAISHGLLRLSSAHSLLEYAWQHDRSPLFHTAASLLAHVATYTFSPLFTRSVISIQHQRYISIVDELGAEWCRHFHIPHEYKLNPTLRNTVYDDVLASPSLPSKKAVPSPVVRAVPTSSPAPSSSVSTHSSTAKRKPNRNRSRKLSNSPLQPAASIVESPSPPSSLSLPMTMVDTVENAVPSDSLLLPAAWKSNANTTASLLDIMQQQQQQQQQQQHQGSTGLQTSQQSVSPPSLSHIMQSQSDETSRTFYSVPTSFNLQRQRNQTPTAPNSSASKSKSKQKVVLMHSSPAPLNYTAPRPAHSKAPVTPQQQQQQQGGKPVVAWKQQTDSSQDVPEQCSSSGDSDAKAPFRDIMNEQQDQKHKSQKVVTGRWRLADATPAYNSLLHIQQEEEELEEIRLIEEQFALLEQQQQLQLQLQLQQQLQQQQQQRGGKRHARRRGKQSVPT